MFAFSSNFKIEYKRCRDFEPGALSFSPLQNQLYRAEDNLRMELTALEAQYNMQKQQDQTANYFNFYDRGMAYR